MRMILYFDIPVETFNAAVRDGTVGEKMQQILEAIGPEHVWFSEDHGQRGGIMIVNVDGPSDIPRLAEPLFLTFDADVRFRVAMTPDDLAAAGLEELGETWG